MAIKKREQIVIVAIGAVVAIFLVHLLIFRTRAKEYNDVQTQFKEGREKLQGAEFVSSPMLLENYQKKTKEYQSLVTSVTASLNIDYNANFSAYTGEGVAARISETTSLLKQLVDMRRTVQRPVLTFLDNRTDPRLPGVQLGWDIPQGLPTNIAKEAIWDTVVKMADRFELLKNIPNPLKRMEQRHQYNILLSAIGVNPAEVSDYYYPYGQTPVFFNDPKWLPQLQGARANDYYGLVRMGPAVPRLKKMWHYELLIAVRDPQSPVTKDRLLDVMELSPDYFPYDETLSHINRQLRALVDIIKVAQKNEVVEIYQVNLMKPVDFAKVEMRTPGQTPTPAPSPDPASAAARSGGVIGVQSANYVATSGYTPIPADQKIGTGTGIEISFRATNTNMVKFLFDLGTTPRTYSVDDLYITASPDGILATSATVEFVTKLEKLATTPKP